MTIFLIAGVSFVTSTNIAHAESIEKENRLCDYDEDCLLINLRCRGQYFYACGENGNLIDTINKKYIEKFSQLGHCTDEENKAMATAGACLTRRDVSTICQNRQCTIISHPHVFTY